jgi:16S rRNA (cytosine1402-N4)-methyltransferase
MATETEGRLKIIGKPRRPGEAELAENPRARSAVLRVAERTA